MIKLVETLAFWAFVALLYVPLAMIVLFVLAAPYLIWLEHRGPGLKYETGNGQEWRRGS